jgi:mono/diheme cytochrome c family protein
MWNHAPAMWRAMAARNLPVPKLEPGDVADLFAYFYSLRYFDPPGDAARGKDVFISARCSSCHAQEGGIGPLVSKWRAATDPVEWAQRMWNHTGAMTEQARKAGIQWPRLTVQQMVDLMVYVQNLPAARLTAPTLKAGNPAAGEKLFEVQGCTRCHTVGGSTGYGRRDLLGPARRFQTLTEFAVAMWNHAPQMRRRAIGTGADLLPFVENEMADLIAYLFEKRYFEERGNASRGARLYKARSCGACHDSGQADAPSLVQFRGRFSPLFITSALWKHGPQMLTELEKRGVSWPQFTNTEMANLIAHLNR